MTNTIIFCESYGQIRIALKLITEKIVTRKVIVIVPGYQSLYQLFLDFNGKVFSGKLTVFYLDDINRVSSTRFIQKIFQTIAEVLHGRYYLGKVWKKHFKGMGEAEVYFLSRGYNGNKYYLLKKLSRNSKLIYIPPKGPPEMSRYLPKSLRDVATLVLYKLRYGMNMQLGQFYTTTGFPWIPDSFIKGCVSRIVSAEERDEMANNLDYGRFRVFNAGNFQVVYFDDNSINAGLFKDIRIFLRELATVFSIVNKHFPGKDEVAYKYHPGYDGEDFLTGTGTQIPSYIPAELVYNESIKVYLSVFSRSIANVESGLTVSIAELVTFKSESERRIYKEDIRKVSKSEIIFPETLEEFEKILVDTQKRTQQELFLEE